MYIDKKFNKNYFFRFLYSFYIDFLKFIDLLKKYEFYYSYLDQLMVLIHSII